MAVQSHIRWFSQIGLDDVAEVGGKTASLGELFSVLGPHGIRVPDGFAITAQAYRDALSAERSWDELRRLMVFNHPRHCAPRRSRCGGRPYRLPSDRKYRAS